MSIQEKSRFDSENIRVFDVYRQLTLLRTALQDIQDWGVEKLRRQMLDDDWFKLSHDISELKHHVDTLAYHYRDSPETLSGILDKLEKGEN